MVAVFKPEEEEEEEEEGAGSREQGARRKLKEEEQGSSCGEGEASPLVRQLSSSLPKFKKIVRPIARLAIQVHKKKTQTRRNLCTHPEDSSKDTRIPGLTIRSTVVDNNSI
ncbi:hypothetical protein M0804_001298 [Polistes exclamans]|nr:hypothetical protein M0804_001298 [Polistes exclamans]